MSVQMNVPKLRFPEFSGEWEEKKLGDITNWASGGTPPKDNELYWNGDIPWISASSMRGLEYSDSEFKITLDGLKKGSRLAQKGSLLILVRGSMLFNKVPIGIASRDVAFNQDVKSIEVSDYSTSKYILYWFISSEPKILNMVTGTGIGAGKLDLSDLKGLELYLPSIPEQTKIAIFLTAIDTKIDKLTKKQTLLNQYKKGVMQKLFSQELRFKADDGSEFPEWEEKTLGEYIDLLSGFAFKGEDISENTNGIPLLRGINITEGAIRHTTEMDRYFCGGVEKLKKYFLQTNDLVISMDGSKVGKNSALISKEDKDSLLVQRVARIRANSNGDIHFLYQIVRSKYFIKYVDMVNTSSGIPHISAEQIKNFPFYFPVKEEQTKIANFLTSIDAKIDLATKQLDATKEFKKALLQQMFV